MKYIDQNYIERTWTSDLQLPTVSFADVAGSLSGEVVALEECLLCGAVLPAYQDRARRAHLAWHQRVERALGEEG